MAERWVRIGILDLGCVGEALDLERRLARMQGVREVAVNPATDAAYIRFDDSSATAASLREAIVREGFRIVASAAR